MSSFTNLLFALWLFLGVASAVLSLPGTIELLLLTLGNLLPRRREYYGAAATSWRLAAIVPAHNEQSNIERCIDSLQKAERGDFDIQIVVIADNCDDETAGAAAVAGARVLARQDANLRGKGYALDFAFRQLSAEHFDGFLIVDADTEVQTNFFLEAGGLLRSGADAVQCAYLVKNPHQGVRTRLMRVAFLAFNAWRPRGRDRLGLSCGILGNGFGMRRQTLETVPYLASSIVEDLEYHISLVRAGKRVRFAEKTSVFGEIPEERDGAKTQRARWEGGRFRMIREKVPGLAWNVIQGRWRSLEPLLELSLLPLAFHVTLLLCAASIPWMPARALGVGGLILVFLHLIFAILVGQGDWQDAATLLAAPFFVAWKLLLIPVLMRSSRTRTTWVRTEREVPDKLR